MTNIYNTDLEEIQKVAQCGAATLIEAAYNDMIIDAEVRDALKNYAVIAMRPEGFIESLRSRLFEKNEIKEGHITFRAQRLD